MHPNPLVSSLVNYTRVLLEARSPRIAHWDVCFVDSCAEWCVYVETELSLLSENDLVTCQQQAQTQLDVEDLVLPSVSVLLDAWHQFYMTLIFNIHVSQDLYKYLLSTYLFVTGGTSARENVVKDLTMMARDVATCNALKEMEKLLIEDGDDSQDEGQDGR
ncbi:hypothetical protein BC941DRAFT_475157 [Chlamydoabsidia padenii]|nr:hypothetical protein BC941DRAFT_475157 [Chlamydoabsidia padenii]